MSNLDSEPEHEEEDQEDVEEEVEHVTAAVAATAVDSDEADDSDGEEEDEADDVDEEDEEEDDNGPLSLPSVSGSPDTRVIPRMKDGILTARHVSTLSSSGPLMCEGCGQEFRVGQRRMVDIYTRGPPVPERDDSFAAFTSSTIVFVHANQHCPRIVAEKMAKKLMLKVLLPSRTPIESKDPDAHLVTVREKFPWTLLWSSWHRQFQQPGDSSTVQLASLHPELCSQDDGAFLLRLSVTHPSSTWSPDQVLAPYRLMPNTFFERLNTRLFELVVTYNGKYNPTVLLDEVIEQLPLRVRMQVTAFTVPIVHYSANSQHTVQLKLLVRTSLQDAWIRSYASAVHDRWALDERSFNWRALEENVYRDSGVNRELDEVMSSLCRDLVSKGFKITEPPARPRFTLNSVTVVDSSPRSSIVCRINCYEPSDETKTYYVFNTNSRANEVPVLAFEGVLRSPMPIVIKHQRLLEDEMLKSGMQRVQLQNLITFQARNMEKEEEEDEEEEEASAPASASASSCAAAARK